MTVTSTNTKSFATGDGTTTAFPFTFQMPPTFLASEFIVYLGPVVGGALVAGGAFVNQNGVGYTVALNPGGAGGTVTFNNPPPACSSPNILFVRLLALTQGTNLQTESSLPEATIVSMIDRTVMIAQQQQEQLNRSFTLNVYSSATPNLNVPDPVALSLIGWDVNAANLVNYNSGGVSLPAPVAPLSSGALGTVFTGNGPGVPGSFQAPAGIGTVNGLFRPQSITSSLRAIPAGTQNLSGTYIHFGNYATSVGGLTLAHGTRIYINGNFTVTAGAPMVVTPQSNGGTCPGASVGGANGGGENGGEGGVLSGVAVAAGGGGGGSAAAGGLGGLYVIVNKCAAGGPPAFIYGSGGGGGGGGGATGPGVAVGGAGGGGGGFALIECVGIVTFNENVTAVGNAGTAGSSTTGGSGGGGGGGQLIVRSTGNFVLAGGKSISVVGGAGGVGSTGTGSAGGGGSGGLVEITSGGTITAASVTVTGGAAGVSNNTPGSVATAGANGTFTQFAGVSPVSL